MADHDQKDIHVILLIGAPGAGKSTLCQRFAKEQGYFHLSVGDYLRTLCNTNEQQDPKVLGGLTLEHLTKMLEARTLIEAEVLVSIIAYKLEQEQNQGHLKFVIDGFPRTEEAAEKFDRKVCRPAFVCLLHCEARVAKDRFIRRQRDPGDDAAMFEKRQSEHMENLSPILRHYKNNKLIDAGGSADDMYASFLRVVSPSGVS
ncbi:uncharacterized protein LTR77_008728 [Saxophila tyrrhenica]|uniref:Adenylate kinase n=1 Tax=Saxophila tyrrhenica TaxID=1690608 RepID=A0AAV9P007_9PEZI|nr:hypothetical protein LTR77_008728 [Saxophila tyrrhenica]